MKCLNRSELQAAADGEAAESVRRHISSCADCAERVRERERTTRAAIDALHMDVAVPDALRRRVTAALASGAAGATRLRPDAPPRRHRAFWSGALATAATIAAVLFAVPMFREHDTVSASEILAASASRLAQAAQGGSGGVEVLDYELVLDGVPRELLEGHANGAFRVWQAIDHDTPGRFRFASYAPGGALISSLAQDPRHKHRAMLVTLEGQPYRFDLTLPGDTPMSLVEIERLHMQASITMMQASGDQLLKIVDTPSGRLYRIDVQQPPAAVTNPVWDLTRGHVVVSADDYRVIEFSVAGTFLKQPYAVSYKLIERRVNVALPDGAFDVPPQPGEIRFTGEGSAVPARDAMVLALREVARLQQQR